MSIPFITLCDEDRVVGVDRVCFDTLLGVKCDGSYFMTVFGTHSVYSICRYRILCVYNMYTGFWVHMHILYDIFNYWTYVTIPLVHL